MHSEPTHLQLHRRKINPTLKATVSLGLKRATLPFKGVRNPFTYLGMTAISPCQRPAHVAVSSLCGPGSEPYLGGGSGVDLRPGSLPPALPFSLLSLSSYRWSVKVDSTEIYHLLRALCCPTISSHRHWSSIPGVAQARNQVLERSTSPLWGVQITKSTFSFQILANQTADWVPEGSCLTGRKSDFLLK